MDINFRLLAQTALCYFRPSNGLYLISILSRTGNLDSSGGTVTRLRAGNTRNRGLIACSTDNLIGCSTDNLIGCCTDNLCLLQGFQIRSAANPGNCSIDAVDSYPGDKAAGA